MNRLCRQGVKAGVVNDARGAVEDKHLRQRGFWAYLDHKVVGSTLYNRAPLMLSKTPIEMHTAAPILGEHTREVLTGMLDYADAEVDQMIEKELLV
nr:CoA transferase [Desulfosarcina cetonica]